VSALQVPAVQVPALLPRQVPVPVRVRQGVSVRQRGPVRVPRSGQAAVQLRTGPARVGPERLEPERLEPTQFEPVLHLASAQAAGVTMSAVRA
jgi:hypothetical protein